MTVKELGLVLSAGPTSSSTRAALRIASTASVAGHRVTIFLSGDALVLAMNTDSNKTAFKAIRELTKQGVEVIVCTVMARDRGIGKSALSDQVVQGSLLFFAELVQRCDRIVHFGAPT